MAVRITQVRRMLFSPVAVQSPAAIGQAYGAIDHATIVSGGFGYTTIPTVTFSAPQMPGGVTATGIAVIGGGGRVTGIVVTNKGNGYTSAPSVSFSNVGAIASAVAISALTITAVYPVEPRCRLHFQTDSRPGGRRRIRRGGCGNFTGRADL